MKRKPGTMAVVMGVTLVSLLAAGSASATSISLPVVKQIGQLSVPKPNGIAYDDYNGEAYVTSVGPPPRIYRYDIRGEIPFEVGFTDLPAGTDPGSIDWGADGYLYVVDHAHDRIFRVCPECGDVQEAFHLPMASFITEFLDLYQAGPTALDFGDSFSAGGIWIGAGLETRIPLPDTITPNGGDILNDVGKVKKGRIQDELLFADANNNQVVRMSDTPVPGFLGTIGGLPGTPGIQPPRDLDVNPLNLNPNVNGAAIHPIFVPLPDLGLYESLGPNGPWMQVPATGIGRPTQVGSDCDTVGITSFSQNLVTFFKQDEPKGSHCEDFVELLLQPESGTPLTLAGALKAYSDGKGRINLLPGLKDFSASTAKSKKKLKLTAGRVTKFRAKLPAAVIGKLRRKGKAVVTVRVKLTNSLGQTARVSRGVRIRR